MSGDPLRDTTVRPATPPDLAGVLCSLTSAAQWSRERGELGWPVPFPEEAVRPSLERGELYVAEWNGEIVGSFVLRYDDEAFWGPQPPVAGYLHQLAVRRDRPVRGLGRRLVDRAESLVREAKRPWIRLDCVATNRSIIAYYEAAGFRPVRVVPYPHGNEFEVLLMEKRLE
ncbi:MAG TPA: GNAT family N-acetyltransferase [Thermoplasmata archaeon]|nr:GNAT family N-acetyltransferase [Thermoplasmata archaeon]